MWIVRDDLAKRQTKGIEMIRFSGIDFLPVNSIDAGFIPIRVDFREGMVPRLVDREGHRIMAWRV